jgi:AraC-like DNA-binding protein
LEGIKEISYEELLPEGPLADFVKCFWRAENLTGNIYEFTILPDGCFGMIAQLHDDTLQAVFLKGIWTKPFDITILPDATFYAVRFKPLAVDAVLLFSISEMVDQNKTLEKSFWGMGEVPFDNLHEFSDLLTAKILAAIAANKKFDLRKQQLFALLFDTRGALSVKEIARTVFWGSRQINRYFKQVFGLSLKAYCNILKVYSSYPQIAKGEFYPQQDYYDQAHFIKNVRQHTGANPKKLYQHKKDRFIQLSIIDQK